MNPLDFDELVTLLHLRYPEHGDAKTGLSKDCPYCQETIFQICGLSLKKVFEQEESHRDLVMRRVN